MIHIREAGIQYLGQAFQRIDLSILSVDGESGGQEAHLEQRKGSIDP